MVLGVVGHSDLAVLASCDDDGRDVYGPGRLEVFLVRLKVLSYVISYACMISCDVCGFDILKSDYFSLLV